jgi:hypothetical protein
VGGVWFCVEFKCQADESLFFLFMCADAKAESVQRG